MDENIENTPNEPIEEKNEDVQPAQQSPPPEPEPEKQEIETNKDSCLLAMWCHLLLILSCFVGPLIIWLLKKDDDEFVNDQGKEALNFFITVALANAASLIVFCLAPILIPAIMIVAVIFVIIAAVKSKAGKRYRYPLCLRLIK